ncbi:MAG: Rnf-Nqr domain containing protein, partial [Pseudoflavonifractor sp.]
MKKQPSKAWLEFRQNAPAYLKKWTRQAGSWLHECFRLEKHQTLQACRDGFWLRSPAAVALLVLCTALPLGASLRGALRGGLCLTAALLAASLLWGCLQRRQEKRLRPGPALMRGLTMGLGLTLALALLGGVREVLGSGSIWGVPILPGRFPPVLLLAAPCGGLMLLGCLGALARQLQRRRHLPRLGTYLPRLQGPLFAAAWQTLEQIPCPKPFRGVPILLVGAGLVLMVAGGFL